MTGGDRPDCVDYEELGSCPGVMFLADPVNVVTYGMTYQEKIYIMSGSVYDYDDYCDSCPDYFDHDEPNDFDDVHGFVGPVENGMCCGLHGPDGSGGEDNSYRIGFGDPTATVGWGGGGGGGYISGWFTAGRCSGSVSGFQTENGHTFILLFVKSRGLL